MEKAIEMFLSAGACVGPFPLWSWCSGTVGDADGGKNIEDTGWTRWKPAPGQAARTRAPAGKKGKARAQPTKRKTEDAGRRKILTFLGGGFHYSVSYPMVFQHSAGCPIARIHVYRRRFDSERRARDNA